MIGEKHNLLTVECSVCGKDTVMRYRHNNEYYCKICDKIEREIIKTNKKIKIAERKRESQERREQNRIDKMTKNLKILCPFCSKIYTGKMEKDLDVSMCDDSYDGKRITTECEVSIICSKCKKIIYKK